jgi:hypothetical protein
MIMEGLSNLAMKPGESTGELLARITNTMVIIKESYASYENKPPAPANFDVNNGFTEARTVLFKFILSCGRYAEMLRANLWPEGML